jgi:hypothetical protein
MIQSRAKTAVMAMLACVSNDRPINAANSLTKTAQITATGQSNAIEAMTIRNFLKMKTLQLVLKG